MEPSGPRTRSSGSAKFSASTMIWGLRFNGTSVAVGLVVGVDDGRGVKVSVTGTVVDVGLNGVREARSGVGATTPHAEESMRQVINNRVRVEAMREWYHTCLSPNT